MLKASILAYRVDFDEEWDLCYKVLKQYDKYFPGLADESKYEQNTQLFIRAFGTVVTRCFGWGLPCTTMVPFADFINHHNVDSSYEFIHRLNKPTDEDQTLPKAYATVSKKEVDYKDFYPNPADDDEV